MKLLIIWAKGQPGIPVEPLDWSNGAVHAMLAAKVRPATRLQSPPFLPHHISDPEIQHLRVDLMTQLARVKPKIIIQFFDNCRWSSELHTTREFPELEQFINENYSLDKEKNGYRLWMRK